MRSHVLGAWPVLVHSEHGCVLYHPGQGSPLSGDSLSDRVVLVWLVLEPRVETVLPEAALKQLPLSK